jgi:aryl-alcohol dehydrogenase
MRVTAAVVREKSMPFTIEELDLDEPREDEVLVRVVATGICHTDIIIRDQYYPVPLPSVLGHEGAGIVERVGRLVKKVKPGDHVALSYMSCGACDNCQNGRLGYCYDFYGYNFSGARADGSTTLRKGDESIHGSFFGQSTFATFALASEKNVVKVREDIPLEILGPLGCGIQTGAGGVINALAPHAGSSIAVFGTGAVGLSAIMAARVAGCTTIIGVDIRPERLKLAEELGATHTINGSEGNTLEQIQKITNGKGVAYSLETTARPQILRQAVECLRVTGVCGLIGAAPLGTEVNLDMNSILFGRTLRGIVEGDSVPDIFIPQLIELYVQGRFPFDKLIKKYRLDEINEAVAAAENGSVLKPVIVFA